MSTDFFYEHMFYVETPSILETHTIVTANYAKMSEIRRGRIKCRPWDLPHGPVLFAPGSTACLLSRTSPLGLVRASAVYRPRSLRAQSTHDSPPLPPLTSSYASI
jgi:hypothetical protein